MVRDVRAFCPDASCDIGVWACQNGALREFQPALDLSRPGSGRTAAEHIESASAVRRDKAALSSGCKSHPATAPAGSNRSSYGGDEIAEAFGMRVTNW